MLFNSIDFALFLPIVFILYWFLTQNNLKLQNALLVVVSYIFYGWWDWRFLMLIFFSSGVDFLVSYYIHIQPNKTKRKLLLYTSIAVNVGLLGFFKYFNFFVDNFINAFSFFGNAISVNSLNIILPVGISFYTFQTLSYTIDVYNKKIEPTKDVVSFFAFVSFFPQLVAGPIERATNLLPQFYKKRHFDYDLAVNGLRQILWGFFKKLVIADNCAIYANLIFNNSDDYSGSTLVLGAIFFAFQIYGDFSGYSDIAIGISRLFGFDLKQNFAFPYFSRDIAEFWRRWHMSLSTWFRDYVYIPLGGSKTSKWLTIRNVFIIFIVSGFWHGANWTFIVWGLLNAIYFLPLLVTKRNRNNLETVATNTIFPNIKEVFSMLFTFALTVFAWVFFRANSMTHAINYVKAIFNKNLLQMPEVKPLYLIVLIVFFVIIEWFGRFDKFALDKLILNQARWLRWSFYMLLITFMFIFNNKEQVFIYFQF